MLGGNPAKPEDGALFHPDTTASSWFTDPDNLSVDPQGRLWVSTDGPPPERIADAVYVMSTGGPARARPRLFSIPPVGSECCSPAFTTDGTSLLISVRQPGELRLDDNADAEVFKQHGTR